MSGHMPECLRDVLKINLLILSYSTYCFLWGHNRLTATIEFKGKKNGQYLAFTFKLFFSNYRLDLDIFF